MVVPVLVGRQDVVEPGCPEGAVRRRLRRHREQGRCVIGGVDEQTLIARGQKVTVVVHLGHGNAVQFKLVGHAGQSSEISLFVGMFEGIAFIGFISPHTISEGQLSKWLIAS